MPVFKVTKDQIVTIDLDAEYACPRKFGEFGSVLNYFYLTFCQHSIPKPQKNMIFNPSS